MKVGGSEVVALRLGNDDVVAAYLGATQVWPTGFYLSGALAAESSLSGALAAIRPLSAAMSVLSDGGGALGVLRPLSGALLATSAFSGDLGVFEDVIFSGDLPAFSWLSGSVAVKRGIAGASVALSALSSATPAVKRGLSGAGAAVASLSGTVRRKRGLVGSLAANASLSGALTVEASGLTSIAFQTSAWVRAASITCPSIQAGDVAVLFDWAVNFTGVPTLAIPSGFTQISTNTGTAHRGTVSYKVLSGTESGVSLSGQTGAAGQNKAILIFRPNGAISTVTTSTWLGEVTTGNPAAQTIAASGQPVPLIRLATAAQNVTGSVSFAAGTFDGTVTAGNDGTAINQIVGYAVQNSSPSDNNVDMNDFGTNWLASGWIRFA